MLVTPLPTQGGRRRRTCALYLSDILMSSSKPSLQAPVGTGAGLTLHSRCHTRLAAGRQKAGNLFFLDRELVASLWPALARRTDRLRPEGFRRGSRHFAARAKAG